LARVRVAAVSVGEREVPGSTVHAAEASNEFNDRAYAALSEIAALQSMLSYERARKNKEPRTGAGVLRQITVFLSLNTTAEGTLGTEAEAGAEARSRSRRAPAEEAGAEACS
jgi:hypothetical protein